MVRGTLVKITDSTSHLIYHEQGYHLINSPYMVHMLSNVYNRQLTLCDSRTPTATQCDEHGCWKSGIISYIPHKYPSLFLCGSGYIFMVHIFFILAMEPQAPPTVSCHHSSMASKITKVWVGVAMIKSNLLYRHCFHCSFNTTWQAGWLLYIGRWKSWCSMVIGFNEWHLWVLIISDYHICVNCVEFLNP